MTDAVVNHNEICPILMKLLMVLSKYVVDQGDHILTDNNNNNIIMIMQHS